LVNLNRDGYPDPDPLAAQIPDECNPQAGCLGVFNFVVRRITPLQGRIAPQAGVQFRADPNPAPSLDGLASVTLTWEAPNATEVEIRIGAPNGVSIGKHPPKGSTQTGRWVASGMTFYLQDISGGKPPTRENTLATVVVNVQ
jgi:hypothetical protein